MKNPFQWKNETTLTSEDIESFMAVHGPKGSKILSFLGQMQEFKAAVNTPVGNMIFTYLMAEADKLLADIVALKATDSDKLKYEVIRNLIVKIASKIAVFEQTKTKIQQGEM